MTHLYVLYVILEHPIYIRSGAEKPSTSIQASYIGLLVLTKNILETCIDVLGFSAPDRM